jgi:hypothetical protein
VDLLDALERHAAHGAEVAFTRHNSRMIELIEKSVGSDTWKGAHKNTDKKG